jgi:uridine kinase
MADIRREKREMAVMRGGSRRIGELLRAAEPRAGQTRVLAIDGRSGSGKTTLAGALGRELGAPVVSLEYLYCGWDGLEQGVDLLVSDILQPLARDRTALVPHYDWARQEWAKPRALEPPELLLVEGVGAGARRAARYESLVIWLEMAPGVRKNRALDRDGATFAPYWDAWAAQEDAMLARERTPERADLVVRG